MSLLATNDEFIQPGATTCVTADYQGSTRVVTTSSGAVVNRHDYLPFGEEIGAGVGSRTTGKSFSQFDSVRQKYAGMETDDATGMAHTLWRKQDNWSGRWTSPDPYGGSMTLADPQSFNRYTYVNNDPVNQVDPSGLYPNDYHGADSGWQDVSGYFWGTAGPLYGGRSFGGAHVNNGTARHDSMVNQARALMNFWDAIEMHDHDGARAIMEANPSIGYFQTGSNSGNILSPEEIAELGPPPVFPQNTAPQGTLTIMDNIRERRAVDVDPPCGNTSNAGACTRGATALTVSFPTNDGANLRARNVDLRMFGTMWITTAPFPYKKRRPVDPSVVNADTARAHEYNAHINVARVAVTPIINEFLGRTFRSQLEFKAAADQLSARVSELFRSALQETQDRENGR